jgi:acyl carrier protein
MTETTPSPLSNVITIDDEQEPIRVDPHLRILERKVMNDTADVLTTVREAFKSAFDVDPRLVSVETSPSDIPGWDSVGHLSLASELEQAFGISLDVDELIEMESVREIVRIITPKLSKEVSR